MDSTRRAGTKRGKFQDSPSWETESAGSKFRAFVSPRRTKRIPRCPTLFSLFSSSSLRAVHVGRPGGCYCCHRWLLSAPEAILK